MSYETCDADYPDLVLEASPRVGASGQRSQELHSNFAYDTLSVFYPLVTALATARYFEPLRRLVLA